MKTIVISTEKGGVGKTTTCLCLASGLIEKGYKVLVIDMDTQANLTLVSDVKEEALTIYELLNKEAPIEQCISKTNYYDLIKGNEAMKLLENNLEATTLKECLKPITRKYDYCIIDTPPALLTTTINALCVADEVITPVQASLYSVQGLNRLQTLVNDVKEVNKKIHIAGVLLTRFSDRANVNNYIRDYIKEQAQDTNLYVFESTIRNSVIVEECALMQKDLLRDYPKAKVTEDYRNFIDELLNRIN